MKHSKKWSDYDLLVLQPESQTEEDQLYQQLQRRLEDRPLDARLVSSTPATDDHPICLHVNVQDKHGKTDRHALPVYVCLWHGKQGASIECITLDEGYPVDLWSHVTLLAFDHVQREAKQ